MQNYSFEANDESGELHCGKVEADNLADAIHQLEASGLVVRSISVFDDRKDAVDQSSFHRRLSETLDQRHRWVPALRAMVEELPNGVAKRETAKLVGKLEQDIDAKEFLSSPDVGTILPLLTSGCEAASNLTRLRDWLGELVRAQRNLARRRRMLIYPGILIALAAGVLVAFSAFLIPIFREMFAEFGLRLRSPTVWTFWIADQISAYLNRTLMIGLVTIVIAAIAIRYWRKRALTNRILGKLVAGTSSNLRCMATLTSTLAELITLDCPLSDALSLAGRASKHQYFERAAMDLSQAISQGHSLRQSEHATRLPPSVIRAMYCGQQQEPSVPLLRGLAAIYSERAQSRKDLIVEGMPAAGVIVLGLLIGFVVVSLFMPLVDLVTSLA